MRTHFALTVGFLALFTFACDGDDPAADGAGGNGGASTGGNGSGGGSSDTSLCAKYGGADNVESVVKNQVVGAIAGDCRINTFFTSLGEDAFTRVNDCLAIQVQELFGCAGVTYVGSKDSNGQMCRSMSEAHLGLGISQADFDALIEDVVAGLSEAGVEQADIDAAAPALLGMQDDIVEQDFDENTKSMCEMGGAGGAN